MAQPFLLGLPATEVGLLALKLPILCQALSSEAAFVQSLQYSAAGFALVARVAKAAARCQFSGVRERVVEPILARPRGELPQVWGGHEHNASGEEDEITPDGGVSTAAVSFSAGPCCPDPSPGQAVYEARLANT